MQTIKTKIMSAPQFQEAPRSARIGFSILIGRLFANKEWRRSQCQETAVDSTNKIVFFEELIAFLDCKEH